MLPERPDLFIDHRNRGDKTLANCIKGRPHGSKKTAVTSANQGDTIVKLNVPAYVEPERENTDDLNVGGVL